LVRTKAQGVDEGGVAAGYAVISSPYLTGWANKIWWNLAGKMVLL
jgi:hypothetical protein